MITDVIFLISFCLGGGDISEEAHKIRARIIYQDKDIVGLDFYQAKFDDSWLLRFKEFPGVTTLWFNGENVTDDTLKIVCSLEQIRVLRLGPNCNVTGGGVARLKGLDRLEELYLEPSSIGDDGLSRLSEFRALKSVRLPESATGKGLRHLKDLNGLIKLSLASVRR